jgi:hypothetical protein
MNQCCITNRYTLQYKYSTTAEWSAQGLKFPWKRNNACALTPFVFRILLLYGTERLTRICLKLDGNGLLFFFHLFAIILTHISFLSALRKPTILSGRVAYPRLLLTAASEPSKQFFPLFVCLSLAKTILIYRALLLVLL